MKPKVFLSYSSKDKEIFNDLVTFTSELAVELVYDKKDARAGDTILEVLRHHIQSSDGCLWVVTKNSLRSKWCPLEVGAFWGAGKPIIIYNPSEIDLKKNPFAGIKYAKDLKAIKASLEHLQVRGKVLSSVTVDEATDFIEMSVKSALKGLSKELKQFGERLPAIDFMTEQMKVQNIFLNDHAAILSKITEMVKRKPKKLICAFDVPSFGSVSAPHQYLKCRDVFNSYTSEDEWDLTILLLPADVGENIVTSEYSQLKKQRDAWGGDINALRRFQRYELHSKEQPSRRFEIGWLEVNRDNDGKPLGVHSMPLNVWISSDEEAVFSTVINNYHPPNVNVTNLELQKTDASRSESPKEIGFSTRDPRMFRFIEEIMKKYKENIDKTIELEDQITASEKEKARIEVLSLNQRKKKKDI